MHNVTLHYCFYNERRRFTNLISIKLSSISFKCRINKNASKILDPIKFYEKFIFLFLPLCDLPVMNENSLINIL
jgi:hypothetical protein